MTSQIISLASTIDGRVQGGLPTKPPWRALLVAGLIGGIAEIIWVIFYAQLASLSATEVARQVVASTGFSLALSAFAPTLGIIIHLSLSVLLAVALGSLVWLPLARKVEPELVVILVAATLVFVWAINFFVVLPRLNPTFATLMPYAVTFVSKLLFGLAAGGWLYRVAQQTRLAAISARRESITFNRSEVS